MKLKTVENLKKTKLAKKLWLIKWHLKDKKISNYKSYQNLLINKGGIEFGGPSLFFKNEIPIYKLIKNLDGVNFSNTTVWEGSINEGFNYNYFKNKNGYQFICDAVEIDKIKSENYDFVLSCNNLEHIANPLLALNKWLRILKPNGLLLLVLPNKESNFDHNRKTTSFEHILEDYKNNITEKDLTHIEEILELHDISTTPEVGDFENFKKRSLANFENRCLHHHVFDMNLLEQIYKYYNLEILAKDYTHNNFLIIGRKK